MPSRAVLDRFAVLTQLPALPSLEEKSRALAGAARAATACTDARAIVFGAHNRNLRRVFFPALEKYAVSGGYFVPHESAQPVGALCEYEPKGDLLVIPLQAGSAQVGALMFDVPERPGEDTLRELRTFADLAAWMMEHQAMPAERELERARRARAESLERVVRMLRDTQTMEEVLLVFAVTVSHEVKLTCAAYEFEGAAAVRRAVRAVDAARGAAPERFDASQLVALLEQQDLLLSSGVPPALRPVVFGRCEGLLASLRIDGHLWGAVVIAGAPEVYDWNDPEHRLYFHMLAAHLELALSGALSFERIQQLARELSESNEFKDDLLAMLAHDFKGPLTVISGYCELLLENTPPGIHEELETIYSQTQRLVRLSEDAVALAHTQAGKFSLDRAVVDLRDLVSKSVKAHNGAGDRIRVMAPAEPIRVSLDSARFNHVLDNLLMNALKYSHDEITVRLTHGESNATIAVSDRGIGIPAAEMGAVFARFGRASNARRKGISGSGVGLYVSRKIVEVHGGSIAVQSSEGAGSTFTVTLPLANSNH